MCKRCLGKREWEYKAAAGEWEKQGSQENTRERSLTFFKKCAFVWNLGRSEKLNSDHQLDWSREIREEHLKLLFTPPLGMKNSWFLDLYAQWHATESEQDLQEWYFSQMEESSSRNNWDNRELLATTHAYSPIGVLRTMKQGKISTTSSYIISRTVLLFT